MDTKLKTFWADLNQNVVVNKRELFLGVTTCALTGALVGILIGMILGPTIDMTIGSYNSAALPQKSAASPIEEETEA